MIGSNGIKFKDEKIGFIDSCVDILCLLNTELGESFHLCSCTRAWLVVAILIYLFIVYLLEMHLY